MEFTAAAIAGFLKGEVIGDPETIVNTIARIEEGHAGALSFLANPKYEPYLYTTKSSVVLVNKSLVLKTSVNTTLIKVDDAYKSFASLLQMVSQAKPGKKGIHPTAVIEPSVKTGKEIYIGAYVYIGENCRIGDNCLIYPHVYIGDNTVIGNNCILYPGVKIYADNVIGEDCTVHAGTVIGSDGFGFAPQTETEFIKIPQIGNVIIEDHVEIGANVAIDRATVGSTIIHKGVKLDNLIQIGHNVEVGENTVIAAQSGIAGSTKLGRNCMIGGQVAFAGHSKIADGVKIGGQSGIPGNIRIENAVLTGSPAIDHANFLKSSVIFKKLPDLKNKVDAIEKKIESMNQ